MDQPSHKWRLRSPHPCTNPACGILHNRPGKDCARCARRMERHGSYELVVAPPKLCSTPACRSRVKAYDRCSRCHQLWKQGINPDLYHRPYRRLCKVDWCSDWSISHACCAKHAARLVNHGDVGHLRGGLIEEPPLHCTWIDCSRPIRARGLCLEHLKLKSKDIILLREFLPELPGHKIRRCIGKPACKRWAILFGRCPDCLYDWQFSLRPPRNFFKMKAG